MSAPNDTPRPWYVQELRLEPDGHRYSIVGAEQGDWVADDVESREDAYRIVACVNACEGIDDPLTLRKQRDDLLSALHVARITIAADLVSRILQPVERVANEAVLATIEASIARAEGK